MPKASVAFQKTHQFLEAYPVILFFQHNNISGAHWVALRKQIQALGKNQLMLVKNTVIQKLLQQHAENQEFQTLSCVFQGPCFALGMQNVSDIQKVLPIIQRSEKTVFLGGLLENHTVNHLDISKLTEISPTISFQLVSQLESKNSLNQICERCIQESMQTFMQGALQLLWCLEHLKSQRPLKLAKFK